MSDDPSVINSDAATSAETRKGRPPRVGFDSLLKDDELPPDSRKKSRRTKKDFSSAPAMPNVISLAKLKEVLRHVDFSRFPEGVDPKDRWISSRSTKDLRQAWGDFWHGLYPDLVNGMRKETSRGDVTHIRAEEWVIGVAGYVHFTRGDTEICKHKRHPGAELINKWCTKNYPKVWISNRRKTNILIHEGLYHLGLPPIPVYLRGVQDITVLLSERIVKDALGDILQAAYETSQHCLYTEDGGSPSRVDALDSADSSEQYDTLAEDDKGGTVQEGKSEATGGGSARESVPGASLGGTVRQRGSDSLAQTSPALDHVINNAVDRTLRRAKADLVTLPREHFLKEVQTATSERSARELAGTQMAIEMCIRSADICLGAVGQVLKRMIDDPTVFDVPEKIGPKYLSELTKTVSGLTGALDSAVNLSRKVGGEPDQTVLHGLFFLVSQMTPQEKVHWQTTREIPGRLLTGGQTQGGMTSLDAESESDAKSMAIDADFTEGDDEDGGGREGGGGVVEGRSVQSPERGSLVGRPAAPSVKNRSVLSRFKSR